VIQFVDQILTKVSQFDGIFMPLLMSHGHH